MGQTGNDMGLQLPFALMVKRECEGPHGKLAESPDKREREGPVIPHPGQVHEGLPGQTAESLLAPIDPADARSSSRLPQ